MRNLNLYYKTIILSCLSLLAFNAANAQARLGFKGGMNLTKFDIDQVETQNLNRAVFGVFGELPITPNVGISTEINYSNEGSAYNSNPLIDETKVSYLEIPVLANIYLSNSWIRPKIFGGPSMSFLMNAENEMIDGSTVDIEDNYKENEIGAVLGAGIDFKITGENYLILDARYDLGLSELDNVDIGTFKNRGFRFNVGFSFPVSSY